MWRPSRAAAALALGLAATVPIPAAAAQTGGRTATTIVDFDYQPHTLTADDGAFDTGVVPPGAEGGRFAGSNATITLNTPGTHAFHCEIHPQAMKGVLTVVGQARAGPTPPSAAPPTAGVDMIDF